MILMKLMITAMFESIVYNESTPWKRYQSKTNKVIIEPLKTMVVQIFQLVFSKKTVGNKNKK